MVDDPSKTDYLQPRQRVDGAVVLVDADPHWAQDYDDQRRCIEAAVGPHALAIEHVGSTAVAGLAAKPILDIVLVVVDSADEPAYVPALAAAGFTLYLREPEWFEHRLLARDHPAVNLHVVSVGCLEVDQMLRFRNQLRASPRDRERYEHVKRELAGRQWTYVQDYADAKSAVILEILGRSGSTPLS